MKLVIFSLLIFFSQSTFAYRYDKLVKTHIEQRTVLISSIKVEVVARGWCSEYEDGNSHDGDCIKWEYSCSLKFKFPGIDLLGKPEAYEMRGGTLLDFQVTRSENCGEEFMVWQKNNLDKIVSYSYEENLYRINYQPGLGADCFQSPHLKVKATLDLFPTNWFYDYSSVILGQDPKYKVSCDKLDRE